MTRRYYLLLFLFLAAGASALRFPQLDRRPMHADESVHAIKFGGLLEKGLYRYDPDEYHGPSLYYATWPVAKLVGAHKLADLNESRLRLLPVLAGLAAIVLLPLLAGALGRKGSLAAVALMAASPATAFYSRYFIHESLLVLFTTCLLIAAWHYLRQPSVGWAIAAGVSVGLMHATKETFVFNLIALAAAALVAAAFRSNSSQPGFSPVPPRWALHLVIALAAGAVVSVILFSSFFTNSQGPLDSLRTYLPWLRRAEGQSPHVHPWNYYLQLLAYRRIGPGPVWTEALTLGLALIGLWSVFTRRAVGDANAAFGRFLGVYAVLLLLGYSLIPYKTPWCIMGILQALILVAAFGASHLAAAAKTGWAKAVGGIVLLAAWAHLGLQAYQACFPLCDSQRNPFVYAHTLADLQNLSERIDELAAVHPGQKDMQINVIAQGGDYWPLPWYLRAYPHVGYWSQVPSTTPGDVIVTSPAFESALLSRGGTNYQAAGYFGLRPAVFLELYVRSNLWQKFVNRAQTR